MSSVRDKVLKHRCQLNAPLSGPFIVCTYNTTIIGMIPMCPICHEAVYRDNRGTWRHYNVGENHG